MTYSGLNIVLPQVDGKLVPIHLSDLVDFQLFSRRETIFVTYCLLLCAPIPSEKGSSLL